MSEPLNPYEAPRADIASSALEDMADLPDASNGARFLNFLVDAVFSRVLMTGVMFLVAIEDAPAMMMPLGLVVLIGYYVILEATTGRTLGKLITGTRVVAQDGGKPRFGQILGRNLARFVPFEPFSFFGSSIGGWHDRWSGTRVVRVRG
jgi:uncharacterized RDD family membrane protein YckC